MQLKQQNNNNNNNNNNNSNNKTITIAITIIKQENNSNVDPPKMFLSFEISGNFLIPVSLVGDSETRLFTVGRFDNTTTLPAHWQLETSDSSPRSDLSNDVTAKLLPAKRHRCILGNVWSLKEQETILYVTTPEDQRGQSLS